MTASAAPQPLASRTATALKGTARVPGDKSISHRSLMLGALAVGETEIHGLLEGEDVLRTAAAMRQLGGEAERGADGVWRAQGRGIGALREAPEVLDLGNAGTGTRLLMGLVAPYDFVTFFTGDASLRSRPMARVSEPLSRMGARIVARAGGRPPLAVIGTAEPMPITYKLPVASAQVKSAILLAGLNTPGITTVIEPEPTRDHTELMLKGFGATLKVEQTPEGRAVSLTGQPEIFGRKIMVPGDPSSAAFPLAAALIVPGSDVRLPNIGLNPHRIGLIETLLEMGADIAIENRREEAGEPVGDLRVRHGVLKGITVPAERAPSMIDEYPILAVVAAFAEGETKMEGLAELRVKESDRLSAMAQGLAACGVKVAEGKDSLTVTGDTTRKGAPAGGVRIPVKLDHRIGMSFLVLGMAAQKPVEIDDAEAIGTSFPGFVDLMNGLGAVVTKTNR
ncbi:MAG TPA: 3-phosphoshikimate 1-carboxyvinyltransferase [Dongiaceae bacterium]|nr:3-phosphoshikimate 1-carboxyvinyltransferase [Dongiaceae bacterium]